MDDKQRVARRYQISNRSLWLIDNILVPAGISLIGVGVLLAVMKILDSWGIG